MNVIKISGLEVYARHGVLESEKTDVQPFLFDIAIGLDGLPAAASDSVIDTVDYAAVCAEVTDFCKNNCFNLIEKLAYGAARLIAEKHTLAKYAEVTVHKPEAPIGLPFGDVSFTARVERNNVVLSLGSNEGDRQNNLLGAIDSLKKVRGLKLLKLSDIIETAPYGGVATQSFLNCAALFECLLSPRSMLEEIHRVEQAFGRVRGERWGNRTLDIDIVFFGNKVIEEEGLCLPHPDYFNRAFVLEPIKQLVPDWVCPIKHKRIADMQA